MDFKTIKNDYKSIPFWSWNEKLYMTGNLRNLLGPHHLKLGEEYFVRPSSFYKEGCVWNSDSFNKYNGDAWDDDYCFVEVGIK